MRDSIGTPQRRAANAEYSGWPDPKNPERSATESKGAEGHARNKTQFTRHKCQVIKVWRIMNLIALCLDTWNLSLPYVLLFANNTGACPSNGLSILPMLFASMPAARITVRSPKRLRILSIAW